MKTERGYEITFEKRKGYLYARVSAPRLTGQIIFDFLSEILMKARDCRTRRILIDRDIKLPPPGEALDAWNHFIRIVQGHRIAIYNPHPQIDAELRRRLSIIESSPSVIRIFDDRPAARAWVIAGTVPDYQPDKPRFLQR